MSARVIVAVDDVVIRAGLAALLEPSGVDTVAVADSAQAVPLARRLQPDAVLLGAPASMPADSAATLRGAATVRTLSAITKVLVLSNAADTRVVRTYVCAGAIGYLVHGEFDAPGLVTAIHSAVAGRANPLSPTASIAVILALRETPHAGDRRTARTDLGLSRRETDIMDLISQGRSNDDIAAALTISKHTVKNHVTNIFAKLGSASRGAAIAIWLGTEAGRGPRTPQAQR